MLLVILKIIYFQVSYVYVHARVRDHVGFLVHVYIHIHIHVLNIVCCNKHGKIHADDHTQTRTLTRTRDTNVKNDMGLDTDTTRTRQGYKTESMSMSRGGDSIVHDHVHA